ncbi:MAG: hypothetical protein U9R73_10610 [Pseudomonadota bacterium]|nr:hypothetical protein [Pseudomonadota bacterium]
MLYVIFSIVVGFIGVTYLYYSLFFDTESKIESAIDEDKEIAADILSRFDFFSKDDPELVRKLAAETEFGSSDVEAYSQLSDKICNNPKSLTCNKVIRDLRKRARAGEAPFNEVGIPVKFGAISGKTQPKRFTLHVNPDFEYAKRVVEISYKGQRLVLYAAPKMGSVRNRNFVHLNISQVDLLGAPRANRKDSGREINDPYEDSAFIVAKLESDPTLYDPHCPDYWNEARNPSLCSLEEAINLSKYLEVSALLK